MDLQIIDALVKIVAILAVAAIFIFA